MEQVARPASERRAAYTDGRFGRRAVKIMQDGVAENYTAAMSTPYLDGCGGHTDNAGLLVRRPRRCCAEAVTRLDAEGFQVHVHAIGDRAVREALDAFEAARAANGPRPAATTSRTCRSCTRRRARFAELGVAANIQALWACLRRRR